MNILSLLHLLLFYYFSKSRFFVFCLVLAGWADCFSKVLLIGLNGAGR